MLASNMDMTVHAWLLKWSKFAQRNTNSSQKRSRILRCAELANCLHARGLWVRRDLMDRKVLFRPENIVMAR